MSKSHKKIGFFSALFLLAVGLLITPGISTDHVSRIKAGEETTNSVSSVIPPQEPPVLKEDKSEVKKDEVKATTTTKAPVSNHYSLKIDSIGLDIPLLTTTLDKQGQLMVPNNPNQAAWYTKGPKPGAAGTALITGHLDSLAGPGVFWNLRKVSPGDLIEVKKPDGSVATFKVDKSESYAQDNTFPWNKVYSTTGEASIRIITCDGVYNPETGRYSRNLVVYATMQPVQN